MDSTTIAICSIFNLPNLLPFPLFPNNAFGLFITLTRTQIIQTWPFDVHGCLGYWDYNYESLDQTILQNKIVELAFDTAFNDDRRKYFSPLIYDPNTEIKISFMLRPLLSVDDSFNNINMGLIYDNGKHRATYLPGVFSNMSVNDIMISLKEKAHVSMDKDPMGSLFANFLAYKTFEISQTLYDSLFSRSYLLALLYNYINFISTLTEVPYSNDNGYITYDNTQDVRNLSVLSTLMLFNRDYFLSWYNNYIAENKSISRQALSSVYNISHDESIADYLWNERNQLDDIFERPQILISLTQSKYVDSVKQDVIQHMTSFSLSGINDIFKANWWAQLITTLQLHDYHDLFVSYFVNIYPEILHQETNYLAVFFEGASFLNDTRLNVALFNVFIELLHRYDSHYGLFKFLDGSMRFDITNHVIHAMLLFLKSS